MWKLFWSWSFISVNSVVILPDRVDAFVVNSSPRHCAPRKYTVDHTHKRSSRPVYRNRSSKQNLVLHDGTTLLFSTTRGIDALQGWATDNGVRFHNHVGLVSSSSYQEDETDDDWGVSVLTSDSTDSPTVLTAGTTVLSVPNSLVLSSTRVQQELVQDYNLDLKPSFNILEDCGFANQIPEFLLMVRILLEVARGDKSRWQPWLTSLPTRLSTGVYMNSFEASCLSPFAFALVDYSTRTLRAFRDALKCLLQQELTVDEYSLSSLKALVEMKQKEDDDNDVVKWAYSIVISRCWKYADQIDEDSSSSNDFVRTDIVPLGDMFNHADPANVVVDYMESDSGSMDDIDEIPNGDSSNEVRFVLTRDIPVDSHSTQQEPLCLSYGLTTNPYRFLILFGFANENMKELFFQVLFTNPSQQMIDLGCNERSRMVYGTEDGAISDVVMDTVLYSLLEQQSGNVEAEDACKRLYEAHVDGDDNAKAAIRRKYLVEICLTLRNHVVRTLNEFDGLVDKVENVREVSGDLSMLEKYYPLLAMIHRHNMYVRGVFRKVKDRLDGMIQTEIARRRRQSINQLID